MKQMKQLISILLLAGALVLVACQPQSASEPAATAAESVNNTTALQDEPTSRGVLAEGELVPLQFATLSFQTGGRVAAILVEEGDEVQAGDPLIQLDATDLELALAQAEARLNSAQGSLNAANAQLASAQARVTTAELAVTSAEASLDLVLAGPRPEEIEALEKNIAAAEASVAQAAGNRDAALNISDAQIEAARAQVAAAQADYEALADGYETIITTCFTGPDGNEVCPLLGPVEENTRFQLEAAELNLQAAQATLNQLLAGPTAGQRSAASGGVAIAVANQAAAQAQLELLLAGATPEQIRQAEVAVDQARLGITQAEVAVTQAEAGVTQAEAAVATAQVGVDVAQAALDRMTLSAPYAGTVARITIDEGEIVSLGVPVLTLADFSSWLVVTTDLTELDVANVTNGAPVDVQFDAIPDETVNGTVTNIARKSSLSQGDIVYEVEIELESVTDLPLRWGMTAFVDVKN